MEKSHATQTRRRNSISQHLNTRSIGKYVCSYRGEPESKKTISSDEVVDDNSGNSSHIYATETIQKPCSNRSVRGEHRIKALALCI